jgi:hypothetical protein
MIHINRTYAICSLSKIPELSEKLSQNTWTLCQGFEFNGYLFLNDSFSENGAQEYAVINKESLSQIESITFGWMNEKETVKMIWRILQGEFDKGPLVKVSPKLDYSIDHSCNLCR